MFYDSPEWQTVLLNINAFACLIIIVRLISFQRKGAPRKWLGAVMAFVMTICAGSIFILIATGLYGHATISETILNCVICINVLVSRGNAMQIVGRFKSE